MLGLGWLRRMNERTNAEVEKRTSRKPTRDADDDNDNNNLRAQVIMTNGNELTVAW